MTAVGSGAADSVRLVLTDPSGSAHTVHAPVGWTLMEAAVKAGIEGIVADCGGACSCATCHVYLNPAWKDRVPPVEEMENDMLECVEDRRPGSRLSCQIRLSAGLDGLMAQIPQNEL